MKRTFETIQFYLLGWVSNAEVAVGTVFFQSATILGNALMGAVVVQNVGPTARLLQ